MHEEAAEMGWEDALFKLFEDLEQQAAGLHLAERDAEVAELSVAEYAQVTLASRVHASVGQQVRVQLLGGRRATGRLARAGQDWMLLVGGQHEAVVRTAAVRTLNGLSPRADPEQAWSVVDRLSLRALLRRLADQGGLLRIDLVDGGHLEGRLGRVGHDFLELRMGEPGSGATAREVGVLPFEAVAVLQGDR